jgi:hypothetical protein
VATELLDDDPPTLLDELLLDELLLVDTSFMGVTPVSLLLSPQPKKSLAPSAKGKRKRR